MYAIGWFTLALINAGLAQGKSRSALLWFTASIVLGPMATLLLVALPRGSRISGASRRELLAVGGAMVVVIVLAISNLTAGEYAVVDGEPRPTSSGESLER